VEVQKQKDLIYGRAIDSLTAGVDNAVEKLMKLVNSRNENIALRAAQSILSLAIKAKETEDTESQRVEEHKRATGIFSAEVVKSAWERDVRSGAIDVTDEKKNTIKRKSEVDLHSINNRP